MRWNIYYYDNCDLCQHPWLPSTDYPKIQSPVDSNYAEASVSSLIDSISNSWDETLITLLFSTQEVQLIQSIPLGQPNTEDRLTWSFVQPGTYMVKSGFNFLSSENYGWFLGIHPITMKCGRRYGVSPYQTRLKVLIDDVCDCDHCKQLPEDIIHAVWSCPCISMAWDSDVRWNFRWTKFFPGLLCW